MGHRLAAEGWVSRPCTVIPNGVNLKDFTPLGPTHPYRERLQLSPSSLIIGHIGRFADVKRQSDLIEASHLLRKAGKPLEIVLVGQGPELGRIQSITGDCPAIHFLPIVSDVASLLRTIDIFVICSAHEGCPRVLLEAMACARPIVATAVGGIPEVVSLVDGSMCARLVPPSRPDLMAQAILELCESQTLRNQLGQAAVKRANDFDIEREWREYSCLYQSFR
jgi:glycosyltransferase involved in cell wall biosynthesis